jgi:lipopolysaccharide biosynthesis regulator YciM
VELDLPWALLGLPLAFALGWLASRLDLRQLRREPRDAPRAYFKGLNLLLNEQQDKAIDAFIEAAQDDPGATDLYFALGNLFRRRGEFERAVRVHQHLLARADLRAAERDRAQHALAQDFMKAGLFDRAEAAYRALEGTAYEGEARLALLSLYERSRDWRNAAEVAARLERAGGGSFATRIAHHWCELAQEAERGGRADEADTALVRAAEAAPQAPRPLLLRGQRLARAGDAAGAMREWDELRRRHPGSFVLVAADYATAALACGQASAARDTLRKAFEIEPSTDLLRALVRLAPDAGDDDAPLRRAHLRAHPTLSAAQVVLEGAGAALDADTLAAVRRAVTLAARPLQRYRCAACGFEAEHWFWQCPGCLSWDSFPARRIEDL